MDPRTFLTALWGESPPGPILIWMLPQKRSQWYHSFDHISEDLAAYPDRDLYTGVGFPAPGTNDLIKFKRGQASDIGGLAGMWADIDIAHPIHKKLNLTPTIDHALEILGRLPFKPTIIIHSGHGLQAWWLFEEPWVFKDQDENTYARTVTQWWHQEVHKLYKAEGMTVDAVQNLDRILRIPGTTNNKVAKDPIPVTLFEEGGLRYKPTDFAERMPPDFEARLPVSRNRGTNEINSNGLVLSHDAEPPSLKLMALNDIDPKFRATWKGSRPDFDDQSASAYDMSLASMAAHAEWTDQEIVDLLIAWRREHGHDLKLRENYYAITVIKARAPIEKASAQEALNDALYERSTDHEEVLRSTLSTLFDVGIQKVVKYVGDPPTYRMMTDRGDITIGLVTNLMTQKNFRESVAAATGILIPKCKPAAWEQRAQALLEACEEVDVGDSSHPVRETRAWITSYLADRSITDDVNQSAITRKPFIKNGEVYLYIQDFRKWIEHDAGEKFNGNSLGQRLKMSGAETESVDIMLAGSKSSRTCWRIPIN